MTIRQLFVVSGLSKAVVGLALFFSGSITSLLFGSVWDFFVLAFVGLLIASLGMAMVKYSGHIETSIDRFAAWISSY